MMFKLTASGIDTSAALEQIESNPSVVGEYDLRTSGESPHRESKDIWFRFSKGDLTKFSESVWLDASDLCPAVKDIAYQVMRITGCGMLGGVLGTVLPNGAKIHPHKDSGWHAQMYRKFYVPLKAGLGSEFVFDGKVIPAKVGEVWEFDNSYQHWVNNDSGDDRIVLVICMR